MTRLVSRLPEILGIATFVGLGGTAVGLTALALGVSAFRAVVIGAVAGVSPFPVLVLIFGLPGAGQRVAQRRQRAAWRRREARRPGAGAWTPDPSVRDLLRAEHSGKSPELEELRYAVPIGAARTVERSMLRFRAIEVYADGFALSGRLSSQLPPDPLPKQAHFLRPVLSLTISDDRLGEYRVRPSGGSGTGHGDSHDWEFRYLGRPAIGSAARELQILVEHFRWVSFSAGIEGWSYTIDLPPGGWRFVVPLPAAGGEEDGLGAARTPRPPAPGGGGLPAAAEPPDSAGGSQ